MTRRPHLPGTDAGARRYYDPGADPKPSRPRAGAAPRRKPAPTTRAARERYGLALVKREARRARNLEAATRGAIDRV